MKIAFVGKGGSGKTTLSSLFIRYLGSLGLPTVAIDADLNQHLGGGLGLNQDEERAIKPLGHHIPAIKHYLRGDNPHITSTDLMIKSTPAGSGSRLVRVTGDNLFNQDFSTSVAGVNLMVTGHFTSEDTGLSCYHSKIAGAELYLNHVVDTPGEYIVMDMTAGADAFASGLFTRFDVTFLAVEPTKDSVSVFHQYSERAADYGVKICAIGNKVEDKDDLLFLQDQLGSHLLAHIGQSAFIRALQKGREVSFDSFIQDEQDNAAALRAMLDEVDSTKQDWEVFTRQGAQFHTLYAEKYARPSDREAILGQIDPYFVMGSHLLDD